MHHAFLEGVSQALAREYIATFRYAFPFTERGRRRPDPPPVLTACVRSAVQAASRLAPDLPLFAGGKSMGGRMTSLACSTETPPSLRGLIFFGFPLHPASNPSGERGAHLNEVELPMLFLQGSRDKLGMLEFLQPLCEKLGTRATLHVVKGGDHSFGVPKRSGRSFDEVLEELARVTRQWLEQFS